MYYFARSVRFLINKYHRNVYSNNIVNVCISNSYKIASETTKRFVYRSISVSHLSNSYHRSKMAASNGGSKTLDDVSDVEIDIGTFKYILIKVYQSKGEEETSKVIVRGLSSAGYHVDIYDEVDAKLHKMGLEGECIGGGRIVHQPEKKTISVYGYSQGYGRADHALTTEILKKRYPDYDAITWSDDGY